MFQTGDFLGIQRSSLARSLKTSVEQNALAGGSLSETHDDCLRAGGCLGAIVLEVEVLNAS